jgi:hypothetical protein
MPKSSLGACGAAHCRASPALQLRPFATCITGQHKAASDTTAAHKRREQRGRELHRTAIGTAGQDIFDFATVVLEIVLGRNVEAEFEAEHGENASVWAYA